MALSFKRLRKSFKFADKGLLEGFRDQQNIKIQIIIGILVMGLALVLDLSLLKILILLIVVAQILSLELINTALEIFIDNVMPDKDEEIGLVKDILAGAVLIAVLFSIVIGAIIFYKPIINLIN